MSPHLVASGSYDPVVRVGLVGCVKTKVDHAAPAQNLYVSTLFRGRRTFVEASCDRWFVLSARHGLVRPVEILEPYEESLNGKSADAKRTWAESVLRQLDGTTADYADEVFEIHAGAEYRNFGLLDGLRGRGARVEIPAEHLGQGEQLAFYARTPTAPPPMEVAAAPSSTRAAGGSYAPLADHLRAAESSLLQLSFPQVERILGRPLPASARRHRAWWSNESSGSHSHARAWMGVGWLVDTVDFNAGTVRFRRGHR